MTADRLSHEMRERIRLRIEREHGRARAIVSGAELTPREFDALAGAAAGETAQTTAVRLGLAADTVKDHRKRVLVRLDVATMAQAIALVYRGGRGDAIDARLPAPAPRRSRRRL